jgi:heme exporter protein CcmD
MSHDPHLGFVIAAYALALVIVAGMVVTIVADYLNLKQALASFAAREKRQDPDRQELHRRDVAPRSQDPEGLA